MGRLYPRGACTKGTNAGILGMQCASHPTQNIVSFAARNALAKPRLISEQTPKWINSSVTVRLKANKASEINSFYHLANGPKKAQELIGNQFAILLYKGDNAHTATRAAFT